MRSDRNQEAENVGEVQELETFERLYRGAKDLLKHFGRANYVMEQPHADFEVHGDYHGVPQLLVFATNLKMLEPPVVVALQRFVQNFPGWEIALTVALWDHDDDWPDMGLRVRPLEIIDSLQRQYFPLPFQGLEYKEATGVRRGTAFD